MNISGKLVIFYYAIFRWMRSNILLCKYDNPWNWKLCNISKFQHLHLSLFNNEN